MAEGYPSFEPRLRKDAFRHGLADGIVVIYADADGVARTSPMVRFVAVARLGDGTDVAHPDVVRIRLGQHRLHHVLRRGLIHEAGLVRKVVGGRGNHASHMQHVVGALRRLEHILVSREVTPNDTNPIHEGRQFLLVLPAWAREDGDVEPFTPFDEFLQTSPTHCPCRSS